MKKMIWVMALMALGVFGFAPLAAAADHGVNLYIDYGMYEYDPGSFEPKMMTIGTDYANDRLLLGGFYSFDVGFSNSGDMSGVNERSYLVYGGYNFSQSSDTVLGILLAYADSAEEQSGFKYGSNMWAVGFEGAVKAEKFDLSLVYLYGISNNYSEGGADMGLDGMSYLKVKAVYYFTDRIGMDLFYRSFTFDFKAYPTQDLSGWGIGFDVKF